jgi:hypothetical protein
MWLRNRSLLAIEHEPRAPPFMVLHISIRSLFRLRSGSYPNEERLDCLCTSGPDGRHATYGAKTWTHASRTSLRSDTLAVIAAGAGILLVLD